MLQAFSGGVNWGKIHLWHARLFLTGTGVKWAEGQPIRLLQCSISSLHQQLHLNSHHQRGSFQPQSLRRVSQCHIWYIWHTKNTRHFNEICESCLLIFSLVVFVYVCVNRDYNLLQGDFVIKIEPPSGWSFGKEWFHISSGGYSMR